jgi:chromosome segregation protein
MYLSRIELFGFKSFAHRVKIKFDKGLTAIVGPNGCGKTNVVDAIRWVLGEQKSSLLRSPKMENIIFNGSKNLKPLSLTEVSITIENTRNVLPTEYSEVTVTRRLYRNGESDYLLNQVPCRLRDILDLFADTGMGSDAYSVIELKMIEEIISNKSDERLRLFEEASGITRYKQRRKQTFRQLESASRDLSRVDDVLAEVEKKVRSLKQQVRKAQQLKEIREELRDLDLRMSGISLAEHLEKLKPLSGAISAQERDHQELSARIAKSDSAHQEAEFLQLNLERRLSASQKELNESVTAGHLLEKQLLQLQEQQKNLLASIDRIDHSIAEKNRKLTEQEILAAELSRQKHPLENKCSLELERFEQLRKQQEALNDTLDKRRSQLQEERRTYADRQKTFNELLLSKRTLTARKEYFSSTMQQLEGKTQELDALVERSKTERQAVGDILAEKTEQLHGARSEEQRLVSLKKTIQERTDARKEQLLSLKSLLDRLQNQITLADSILEKFEGLPEGIAFIEKKQNGKPGLGCLSDLLSLDGRYKKAVNAAFGESLSYYICHTLEEAKAAIAGLTRADKGKVHFLVLELLNSRKQIDYPEIDGAMKTIDVISFPGELGKMIPLMLQQSYIVSDFAKAEKLAAHHPEALFITPDGDKFTGKGLLFGGSAKGSESLRLGRKSERDKLQKEQTDVAAMIAAAEKQLSDLKKELEAIRLEEVQHEAAQLAQEIGSIEKNLTRFDVEEQARKEDIAVTRRQMEEMSATLEGADKELAGLVPEIERLEKEAADCQQNLHGMQESMAAEENRSRELNRELQTQQNRYRDAHLDLEKLGFRINACQQGAQVLTDELSLLKRDRDAAEKTIADLGSSIQDVRKKHEEELIVSAGQQQALSVLESSCRELQGRNHETLSALREMRRSHDLCQQMLLEFNSQRTQIEQSIDHLRTAALERYNCELDDIPLFVPEEFDREKASARLHYLQKLKDQFGAVNELAMEEYENEKARFEFLATQKEDLLGAEQQLRNTIEEINKTALQKFQETYTEVRKNFIRIFHELFDPEDEVDLLVHSDEDPLEAHIEIIAKPRGKKPLAIEQLSGGEKALTALSLLFAIYLVKPSPFCILDEVDAPLDDANIGRFIKLLKKFENNTQFIIVTHNKKTMASCQALYGVTMEEEGVSKLIPVKIEKASSEAVPA